VTAEGAEQLLGAVTGHEQTHDDAQREKSDVHADPATHPFARSRDDPISGRRCDAAT
jgi:hypothetical protein